MQREGTFLSRQASKQKNQKATRILVGVRAMGPAPTQGRNNPLMCFVGQAVVEARSNLNHGRLGKDTANLHTRKVNVHLFECVFFGWLQLLVGFNPRAVQM